MVFDKENSIIRKDLIINAKQGVKIIEPNRLTRIRIFNNLEPSSNLHFKSYHFFYTEGEFGKSLMNRFYVAGEEHYINTYNFDYHNELKNGTTVLPTYGPDTTVNTYQADSSLFNLPSGHNPSKISTTYTKEEGATFRLGILLDFVTTTQNPYGNIILMSLLNGSSRARAKGAHELVDFNGDGIPDIVYKKNDGLYMRPGNISDTGSLTGFGIERKIENLSSNFSYTDTKTKSRGKDFGGSISFLNWSIFANTSTISSTSKSTTPTYLIDANSDGLMDVVDGKEVWFNRIVNGVPSFTKYSNTTENMVITANTVEPPALEMLPSDDVIKFWVAPKDGYIRFHDEISVENVNGANAVYSIEVPVTINNVTTTKRIFLTKLIAGGAMQAIDIRRYNDYFSEIQAMPPYNAFNHLGYDSSDPIFVKSGQKVYIRLHQNEDDNYKVNSNPEIVYVDPGTGNDISNNNLEEQDGFNVNNGSYSTNFMLNNHDMGLKLNQPGNITINVPTINFDRLNDDVKIRFVVQGLVSSQLTELNSITQLQSASPVTINPYSVSGSISEPSVLMCYVESLSHIKYKDTNINNIKVNYTTGGSSYDLNLVPTLNSYYIKDLKPRINLEDHTNISPVDPKTYGVQINKNLIFNQTINNSPDFSFAYVIKKKGLVLGKRKVFITHTNNSASLYEVDLATNQVINGIQPIPFFTGQFSDASLPDERISIQVYVQNAWDASLFNVYKSILNQKIFNVYYDQNVLLTSVPETSVNSEVLNPVSKIYKNWGQFLYRNEDIPDKMGNSCKITGKCDEYGVLIDDLRDPVITINTSNCNHITNPNDMQACVAQNSNMTLPDNVFPLTTLKINEVEKWKGIGPEQYSSAFAFKDDEFSTGLFGTTGIDTDPSNNEGTLPTIEASMSQMRAADKVYLSSSKTKSYSGGASGNIGLGASMGYSESSLIKPPGSILLQDFTDLNGDGYPDLVTKERIQYSLATGGHKTPQSALIGDYVSVSNNYQNAITLGANFNVKAFKTTGSNSRTGQVSTTAQADNSSPWSAPVGISGTYNFDSKDFGEAYWLDINGDGLLDRISGAGPTGLSSSINYGKGFYGSTAIYNASTYSSYPTGSAGISYGTALTDLISTLAGLNLGFGIDVSAGASKSTGTSEKLFEDINGDGMIDILTVNSGALNVRYNLGNKFADQSVTLTKSTGQNINFSDELETNNGYGSIGAHVYIPIGPIPILPIPGLYLFNMWIKIGADIAGNIGMSMAEVKKGFKDMNGDGYNDLVRYEGSNLIVNYSRIGKTNKLKTVSNQDSKATFTIDYEYTNPDYNDPNARLVMSEVRVFNPDIFSSSYNTPTPGKDMVKRFKYEKSRYDRRERTHLGYEKVISADYDENNTVYRKNVSTYYNQSFHSAGLLNTSELFSNSDVLLSKTENKYDIYAFNSTDTQIGIVINGLETFDAGGTQGRQKAVVLPSQNITTEYEDGNAIEVSKKMYYNAIGQLIRHEYSSPSLSYHSEISYHSGLPNNIINVPQSIDVYPGLGSGIPSLKHRETVVNNNGDITEIRIQLDSNNFAVTNLGYDSYGNVNHIRYPENENGERYQLNYEYDGLFNKYIVQTRNSFDEISYAKYDSSYDVPTEITDIAGNLIEYSYDIFGRLIRVLGPKERLLPNTIYSEKFTAMYFYNLVPRSSGSSSWVYRSNTLHYNADDPYNPIETISFSDGLGRVVQTKKDIEHLGIERMSVSGNTNYDVFGRIVKQYHPGSENKAPNPTINTNINNYLVLGSPPVPFSAVKYDLKDRAIKYTSEDLTDTDTYYKIENNMFKVTTSIIGQDVDNYTNAEGKTGKIITYANNLPVETSFQYDNIGQLTSVRDPENTDTEYQYDMAGRKLRITHPDRGTFTYVYDPAGNMIKMSTGNLSNDSSINQHFIKYNFHYNRLINIILPDLPNGSNPNNVFYEYGGVGSGNNTGRVTFKMDGTGYSVYEYGNLGELNSETRAIYGYNVPTMYFNTRYSYDSWNRLRKITYPDGETVNYTYNVGGNLKSVFNDDNYSYINNIKYDQFEQRESISYGNGTKSNFSYDYQNRRLSGHTLSTGVNNPHYILANSYSYDGIGNVTSIINNADVSPNQMGGGYEFEYRYDTMSRLTDGRGQFRMKVVKDEVTPPVPGWSPYSVSNSTVDLQLQYNPSGSIAVKKQAHEQDLQINTENTYENYYEYNNHKIMRINDPNTGQDTGFEHDYNGNVVAEYTSNGGNRLYWDEQDRMKAYYNDNTGVYQYYTYDDGGERTIKYNLSGGSQLYQNGTLVDPGSMGLNDYRVYSSPRIVVNSDGQYSKHYFEGSRRFASRIIEGSDIFSRRVGTDTKKGEDKSVASELDFKTYLDKAGLATTIEIELGSKAPQGSGQAGLYYLHGDHLGTATYVTDANGETTQFFLNLPFGETMAEQMIGVYENPYKFNAKEIDRETGFYYYGARYYNPKWSLWYGVDPLAEKMPSWSPYNYTFNNPVKYTDPDGREPFNEYDKNGKMISNLGGNKIDFYHQKNGDTKVVSRQTGASNVIKGGESIISGYTHRGKDVGWGTITGEFFGGDGPTRSLFSDFNDSNSGPFASLDRASSPYSSLARQDALNSKNSKGVVKMDYSHANPLTANFDGYEQMWGRSNVSWYKLGDETLFLMTDSKSQESLFYRLPVNNFERTEGKVNSFGNTYQTYIWTESNSEVQKKAINPTLKNVFKQAITPPSILTRP